MDYVFAPGCALFLYKPALIAPLHRFLQQRFGAVELLSTCCQHTPQSVVGRCVINTCPGCDRRYRQNYAEPSTVSLWEILADSDFPFPDYNGTAMSIIDACPTRDQGRVHEAVRALASRMHIRLIEPAQTREASTCCGDSFYGRLPKEDVLEKMQQKAAGLPADAALVYCVSCCKSLFNGGRQPRYLVDLLFNEPTLPGTLDPDHWHRQLDDFIALHRDEAAPGQSS